MKQNNLIDKPTQDVNMVEILGVKYITDKEASQLYGYSVSWFQKRRHKKLPPPYIRLLEGNGKIFYPIEELNKWFKDNIFIYK